MAATKLYVNIAAGGLDQALVRSVTDMSSVGFPELVIGDARNYELYFVNGTGGFADWSGNGSYIPEIAIGECGYPTGGTFTLKFGANTTSALAWNASAATVRAALEALASIGSGNVLVTGQGPNYYAVTFVGALAGAPQALLIADFSLLTPQSNINVFTLVVGSSGVNAVQVVNLAINPLTYADNWTTITNGWTGQLSTATVAMLQAFAAAGASLAEVFQVTVLDADGISTTYVKQGVTIDCTIINPSAYAGTNQPTLATQAALSAAILGLNNFTQETISSSSTGNSNVTRATTSRLHTAIVTFTGAAGLRTISLLTSNSPNAGDKIVLQFLTPATAGLVLEVHNATSGGTLLSSITTTVDQEPFYQVYHWTGSAWALEFDSGSLLAKIGNLAGLASPLTSRLNLKTLFSKGANKTTDFTVGTGEDGFYYSISTAAGAVLATLPSASAVGEGFLVCLQKTDSSASVVTTSPPTTTLSLAGQSIVLRSDASNWTVVLQYNPNTVGITSGNVVLNLPLLTGLVGGGTTNLDGLPTAAGATPVNAIVCLSYGVSAQLWQLVAGTDAASISVVRPVDYNASTNAQVWKLILDFGQYVSSSVVAGSAVSLTTAMPADVTSISLPAGAWDVSGSVYFAGASATFSLQESGIGTTTTTIPTTEGQFQQTPFVTTTQTVTPSHALPPVRLVLAATTTVYLGAKATFSAGTVGAYGQIGARRVR